MDFKTLIDSNKSWEEVSELVTSYVFEKLKTGKIEKLLLDFYRLDISEERVQHILVSKLSLEVKCQKLSQEVVKRIRARSIN